MVEQMTDEMIYGYKGSQFIHKKDDLTLDNPIEIRMDDYVSSPAGRGYAHATRFVVGTMRMWRRNDNQPARLIIAIVGDVHHVSLNEQNEDELLAILLKRRDARQNRSMQ